MNNWTYKKKEFTSEMIKENFGFIYLITNITTGKLYIGKKQFHSYRKIKQKGKKNRKLVIKESDWKKYHGSSKHLREDLDKDGLDKFDRTMIKICKTKWELTYYEAAEQFKRQVLLKKDKKGERVYYNENILNKFFPPRKQV
jgi:hypothetical protein